MPPFTISTEIDLTLILAVMGCTVSAIAFIVGTYTNLYKNDMRIESDLRNTKDYFDTQILLLRESIDAQIRMLRENINHVNSLHDKDIKNIVDKIDNGFLRIEHTIRDIALDLKQKVDKPLK